MRTGEIAENRGNVRFGGPAKVVYRHQTSGRFRAPAPGEDPVCEIRPLTHLCSRSQPECLHIVAAPEEYVGQAESSIESMPLIRSYLS